MVEEEDGDMLMLVNNNVFLYVLVRVTKKQRRKLIDERI